MFFLEFPAFFNAKIKDVDENTLKANLCFLLPQHKFCYQSVRGQTDSTDICNYCLHVTGKVN